ncbi:hypothetical protein TNCV_3899951 [Trichonephila clavipes]|nr:hypothetical protein TNCV_3899951 [Trichonephila clavipes]
MKAAYGPPGLLSAWSWPIALKNPFIYEHLGLGLNPGESMNICKCILPSQHGGTLNSHRAASPPVRLVEEEDTWEARDHPRVFSHKNCVDG